MDQKIRFLIGRAQKAPFVTSKLFLPFLFPKLPLGNALARQALLGTMPLIFEFPQ